VFARGQLSAAEKKGVGAIRGRTSTSGKEVSLLQEGDAIILKKNAARGMKRKNKNSRKQTEEEREGRSASSRAEDDQSGAIDKAWLS